MSDSSVLWSVGLMSGTSMDGIDVACLRTDGQGTIECHGFFYYPYEVSFHRALKQAELMAAQCQGNMERMAERMPDFHALIESSRYYHESALRQALETWNRSIQSIDVIGYHGQTLYHGPQQGISLQISDGQGLANALFCRVVDQFRLNDVHHGGQGAPLAPLYHQALAMLDSSIPLVVLNGGGIANITVIQGDRYEDVQGFDLGPGNVLLDRWVRHKSNGQSLMDANGAWALAGKIDSSMRAALNELHQSIVSMPIPRSLDSSDFHLPEAFFRLSLEDGCATLADWTACFLVDALEAQLSIVQMHRWRLLGGLWHHPVVRQVFEAELRTRSSGTIRVEWAQDGHWASDALESRMMAWLAVRSLKGLVLTVPSTTGVSEPCTGGWVHHPLLPEKGKP